MESKEILECRYMSNNTQTAEQNRTRGHSKGLGQILRMELFLHSFVAREKIFPNIVK